MEVIIGLIAAVLIGVAGAATTAVVVTVNSSPDKTVNFSEVHTPKPWAGVPNYDDK